MGFLASRRRFSLPLPAGPGGIDGASFFSMYCTMRENAAIGRIHRLVLLAQPFDPRKPRTLRDLISPPRRAASSGAVRRLGAIRGKFPISVGAAVGVLLRIGVPPQALVSFRPAWPRSWASAVSKLRAIPADSGAAAIEERSGGRFGEFECAALRWSPSYRYDFSICQKLGHFPRIAFFAVAP